MPKMICPCASICEYRDCPHIRAHKKHDWECDETCTHALNLVEWDYEYVKGCLPAIEELE